MTRVLVSAEEDKSLGRALLLEKNRLCSGTIVWAR
jgi:hypothetical protein